MFNLSFLFGNDTYVKACFMSLTGGNKTVVFHKLDLMVVLTSFFYHGGMESHKLSTKMLNELIVPVIITLKKQTLY
ncbi:MAG TPA: hypothetical protein DCM10_13825 [Xanthomarina gelatinilytica]|nr:hypothetical protein [Xanthomarina gelatinilytica]